MHGHVRVVRRLGAAAQAVDCSPHLLEDKLGLEGLALAFGTPYSHDQGHLYFACKTAFLSHVVFCDVELQHRPGSEFKEVQITKSFELQLGCTLNHICKQLHVHGRKL